MRLTLKFLLLVGLIINHVADASETSSQPKKIEASEEFAKKKAKVLEIYDNGLSKLNENKACVTAAQDIAAIKTCLKKAKDYQLEIREEVISKKIELLEKRKEEVQKQRNSTRNGN